MRIIKLKELFERTGMQLELVKLPVDVKHLGCSEMLMHLIMPRYADGEAGAAGEGAEAQGRAERAGVQLEPAGNAPGLLRQGGLRHLLGALRWLPHVAAALRRAQLTQPHARHPVAQELVAAVYSPRESHPGRMQQHGHSAGMSARDAWGSRALNGLLFIPAAWIWSQPSMSCTLHLFSGALSRKQQGHGRVEVSWRPALTLLQIGFPAP